MGFVLVRELSCEEIERFRAYLDARARARIEQAEQDRRRRLGKANGRRTGVPRRRARAEP